MRVVLVLLLVSACKGDDGDDVLPDAPPDAPDIEDDASQPGGLVDIGTGGNDFELLAPEQELGLVTGPQGGYHFIMNARITGMSPGNPADPGSLDNPATLFTAYDETGREVDDRYPPYHLGYEDVGDGTFTLPSGRIMRIKNEEVPAIYGTRVKVAVRVADTEGHVAVDDCWVVVGHYELLDAGPP